MIFHRFQIYQLTVPSLPPGGLTDLPLQLDSDAPFALRLVKSRNIGVSGWQFQTPKKLWQSPFLRTDLILPQFPGDFARPSHGSIVRPPLVYPTSSQIVCNIGNSTGETITNARLTFYGSKLFQPSAAQFPSYPSRMAVLPFTYPVVVPNMPAVGTLKDLQLRVKSDADFVYRHAVCDPFRLGVNGGPVPGPVISPGNIFVSQNFSELYVMIRDEARKAYMNEPIHVDDLMGQGLPSIFNVAGANNDGVLFFPGLTTPEIYIQREHSLYFDLTRNDPSGVPVDLHFRFQGMKVFER